MKFTIPPTLSLPHLLFLAIGLSAASVAGADPDADACLRCGPVTEITGQNVKNVAVKGLQSVLRENVGEGLISSCRLVLEESFGQGFTATAGVCELAFGSKTSYWMICRDDGVGNFNIQWTRLSEAPEAYTKAELAKFLQSCVGG
jgi:hypothetical protein